ncbi:MAG: threonine synthase [Hyphomicrobiales bacterium]
MKYISTRGHAGSANFEEVLLKGLAGDGGLYVPEQWPEMSHGKILELRGLDYEDLAFEVMWPFVSGAIDNDAFRGHIDAAYAGFNHQSVTPLVQSGTGEWILELHHGPTLAFKDLAMQLLGRLMDHVLAARNARATIVCATSGDTGGAAVDAFAGTERADLFVLLPKGRVSDVQRRMMTTNDAPNVYALEVDGNFDDCQGIVKAMFAHDSFRERVALSGVNSINWARIVAQTVYYFAAALALGGPDRKISFTVPTGNFGDIFAAYVAKRMGLPIDRLVIATNVNDILARTFAAGRHEKTGVQPTSSPSMDIEVSSNFERLVFDLVDRYPVALQRLMAGLGQSGSFTLPATALEGLRANFDAGSADEAQTADMIARIHDDTGMLIDPHTAVALHVARAQKQGDGGHGSPMVVLSTAHAAKFPDAVEAACGIRPPLPPAFGRLMQDPERMTALPNDIAAVEAFILDHSRVSSNT